VYLVIDHAYRTFRTKERGKPLPASRFAVAAARALTLLGVLVGSVFFRADSVRTALRVLKGMAGQGGLGALAIHREPLRLGFIVAVILATQLLPNSQELLGAFVARPRGEAEGDAGARAAATAPVRFRPNRLFGAIVALVAFASIVQISDSSVFLYFNF